MLGGGIFVRTFFARMRSTQKCENMNACLNQFLRIHLSLHEFVQHFDRAITKICHNETKVEFESNNSSPILSTKLIIIKKHAANVFTKESFFKFHDEMKNVELYFVIGIIK